MSRGFNRHYVNHAVIYDQDGDHGIYLDASGEMAVVSVNLTVDVYTTANYGYNYIAKLPDGILPTYPIYGTIFTQNETNRETGLSFIRADGMVGIRSFIHTTVVAGSMAFKMS